MNLTNSSNILSHGIQPKGCLHPLALGHSCRGFTCEAVEGDLTVLGVGCSADLQLAISGMVKFFSVL